MARMPSAEGNLTWVPLTEATSLVAPPVAAAAGLVPGARVAEIDDSLADTAAFCGAYGVTLEASANCIVVAGKRADTVTYAACVVLATTRADVNGAVRKLLGARKISFAPMDEATALTGMEYGGITPIGLPSDWRVLVDSRVLAVDAAIVGAGIRGAKIELAGSVLASLPGVEVIDDLAKPLPPQE